MAMRGTPHRPPTQPKRQPCRIAHHQILRQLRAVKCLDPSRRQIECGAEFGRDGCVRRINFGLRHAQRRRIRGLPTIKPRGEFNQRRITACADIGDDAGNNAIHLLRCLPRIIQ